MKAWRKAAAEINRVRKVLLTYNNSAGRELVPVPPTARKQAQRRELWNKANKNNGLLTTWLLASLLIKGGYQPTP